VGAAADCDRGFTLVEVVVAAALLIVAAAGVAQLVAIGVRASRIARGETTTALLAAQKMEQLRSLSWTFDSSGGVRSDTSTDVSRDPVVSGGTGLGTTPAGSLEHSVDGCVDYLDGAGRWIGTGTAIPANTVYVRRWAVLPLMADPVHTRVLVVVASALEEERALGSVSPTSRPRLPQDTLLVAVKTRQVEAP
jgi:prepilin-type N-terminal cleavage/methylation domain-containing protein